MSRLIQIALLAVMLTAVSGCGLFLRRPVATMHDPVRTLCGAIGLIHWNKSDTPDTIKQVKAHNSLRRIMCPAGTYEEWYYDGDTTMEILPALVGPPPVPAPPAR